MDTLRVVAWSGGYAVVTDRVSMGAMGVSQDAWDEFGDALQAAFRGAMGMSS